MSALADSLREAYDAADQAGDDAEADGNMEAAEEARRARDIIWAVLAPMEDES